MQPPEQRTSGYYGLPVLKRPHWKWEIALYFWAGGTAAGAYTVATIAELAGDRTVARAGRWVALPLLIVSPMLLIKDLGRPEKFYNMLRIIKLVSPMSVGTWVLSAFGALSGLSALLELAGDRWQGLRRLVGILGTPFALLVGGYTGVLLAATAVPLWHKNRLLWGPTFLASAFTTGTAAIQAALALTASPSRQRDQALERVHRISAIAETTVLVAGLARLGPTGRLLTRGRWSTLFLPGVFGLGLLLPEILQRLTPHQSRSWQLVRALCTLLGGLIFRFCMVYGGQTSAADVDAYRELTTPPQRQTGREGSRRLPGMVYDLLRSMVRVPR